MFLYDQRGRSASLDPLIREIDAVILLCLELLQPSLFMIASSLLAKKFLQYFPAFRLQTAELHLCMLVSRGMSMQSPHAPHRTCYGILASIYHPPYTGVENGSCAHGTGLQGHVQCTVGKSPASQHDTGIIFADFCRGKSAFQLSGFVKTVIGVQFLFVHCTLDRRTDLNHKVRKLTVQPRRKNADIQYIAFLRFQQPGDQIRTVVQLTAFFQNFPDSCS